MWDGMSNRPGLSPRLRLKHLDDQETKRKKNVEKKENLKTQGKHGEKNKKRKRRKKKGHMKQTGNKRNSVLDLKSNLIYCNSELNCN